MKKLLLAFQFLTILPVGTKMTVAEEDIPKSASFFVVVGLAQGILLVAADYLLGMVFHPDLVTGLILFVLVLSNGGFHLDGLADTFDALSVKSTRNPEKDMEKRLAVMKDSSTGPMGVASIVFVVLLKYLSLKNISHLSSFTYYLALILMPALSKWVMVIAMFYGNPASKNGLGKIFIGEIRFKNAAVSTFLLVLFMSLPYIFFRQYIPVARYVFYAVLFIAMYSLSRLWVVLCKNKFGGLTGDSLGAISEISETIFLFMVIAWSRLFI